MPKQYEAIRNRFIREGMAAKEAKTRAAKIYNASHDEPVTRKRDNRENRGSMSLATGLPGLRKPRLPSLPGGKLFNRSHLKIPKII